MGGIVVAFAMRLTSVGITIMSKEIITNETKDKAVVFFLHRLECGLFYSPHSVVNFIN